MIHTWWFLLLLFAGGRVGCSGCGCTSTAIGSEGGLIRLATKIHAFFCSAHHTFCFGFFLVVVEVGGIVLLLRYLLLWLVLLLILVLFLDGFVGGEGYTAVGC